MKMKIIKIKMNKNVYVYQTVTEEIAIRQKLEYL